MALVAGLNSSTGKLQDVKASPDGELLVKDSITALENLSSTTSATPGTVTSIAFTNTSKNVFIKNVHTSAATLEVSFDAGLTYISLLQNESISVDIARDTIIVKSTLTASVAYTLYVGE